MAAPQSQADRDGTGSFLLVCLASVAAATAAGAYADEAASLLLDGAQALFRAEGHVDAARGVLAERVAALDAAAIGTQGAWEILDYAARPVAWTGSALVALSGILASTLSVPARFRRSFTMRRLLAELVRTSPCVAPALHWPGGILSEPDDEGPWMTGRQPSQVAAALGLLLDEEGRPVPGEGVLGPDGLPDIDSPWLGRDLGLDRERTRRWFLDQFGERWQGVQALPAHLKKLACAFLLFACERKDEAQALLDSMSLSFRAPQPARKGGFTPAPPFWHAARPAHGYVLDTRLAVDAATIEECLAAPQVAGILAHHRVWRDTAILALYAAARAKGVLPTAEFLWLRPLERRLHYLLNTLGRRTAWTECAGLWAHWQAEEALAYLRPDSRGIEEPQIDEAVHAFEVALYEEGWLQRLSRDVNPRRFGMS